jgi:GT2 family glycosyltransferase
MPHTGTKGTPSPALSPVAVALVTHNALDDVKRLLADLRAQEGVALRIVVADNASTDGTVAWLREQPDVEVIANPRNVWLSPAWAQGVRATDEPWVLLLTPDTGLADPRTLRTLVDALERNSRAGLAGPRLVGEDGADLRNGVFSFPTPRWVLADALGLTGRFGRGKQPHPLPADDATIRSVPFVNGCCMLVRRAALDEIGGLDERFKLYWEEIDLCHRLRDAGREILLVPTVTVVHRRKGTPMRPGLRSETWVHGERIYLRKHHGALADYAVRIARRLRPSVKARGEQATVASASDETTRGALESR